MPPKKQNGDSVKATINRTRKVSQTDPNRPSYGDMIKEAIKEHKNRKGSSREYILKYITDTYNVPKSSFTQTSSQLRQALKRGVESGALKQVTGTGASGSFKLGDTIAAAAPKKPKTTTSNSGKKPATMHATKNAISLLPAEITAPKQLTAKKSTGATLSPPKPVKKQLATMSAGRISAKKSTTKAAKSVKKSSARATKPARKNVPN